MKEMTVLGGIVIIPLRSSGVLDRSATCWMQTEHVKRLSINVTPNYQLLSDLDGTVAQAVIKQFITVRSYPSRLYLPKMPTPTGIGNLIRSAV